MHRGLGAGGLILARHMEHGKAEWNGIVDRSALAQWDTVLARRVGDRNEWWIGLGREGTSSAGPDWGEQPCFGFAGYDLKNEFEDLSTKHPVQDGFPRSAWWTPRITVHLAKGMAAYWATPGAGGEARAFLRSFLRAPGPLPPVGPARWTRTTPRERYLQQASTLLQHVHRGDIYEVNYCTRRTALLPELNPYAAFERLVRYTDAPHAAFLRWGNHFALCASPERFFRLEQGRIFTQPMKGTRPRGLGEAEDRALVEELAADAKERSENIMALDVARNDLGRVAVPGSVQVGELCAVKTFPNVHQMVSSASARIRPGATPMQILRATFPMASMTGAPKVRAMQLIDGTEDMARGLYSGTMGFFLPGNTADLNVVIRTITWDAATGEAALLTGGALTAASDPVLEWEECEHKARSVLNALGHAC